MNFRDVANGDPIPPECFRPDGSLDGPATLRYLCPDLSWAEAVELDVRLAGCSVEVAALRAAIVRELPAARAAIAAAERTP